MLLRMNKLNFMASLFQSSAIVVLAVYVSYLTEKTRRLETNYKELLSIVKEMHQLVAPAATISTDS